MRMREFLLGRPVDLALDCPQEECAARIRAALPAHEWPLASQRVVGQVGGGGVALRYKGGFLEKRTVPELAAQIVGDAGGARLKGRFGASPPAALGMVAVAVAMPVVALLMLRSALGDLRTAWALIPVVLVLPTVPLTILIRDARIADRDWTRIVAMLGETCGLRR